MVSELLHTGQIFVVAQTLRSASGGGLTCGSFQVACQRCVNNKKEFQQQLHNARLLEVGGLVGAGSGAQREAT